MDQNVVRGGDTEKRHSNSYWTSREIKLSLVAQEHPANAPKYLRINVYFLQALEDRAVGVPKSWDGNTQVIITAVWKLSWFHGFYWKKKKC